MSSRLSHIIGILLIIIVAISMMVAVFFPTATIFAADNYTKVDIDEWDYDRVESLKNQISVQGDVEYVPPKEVENSSGAALDIDYSNQLQNDSSSNDTSIQAPTQPEIQDNEMMEAPKQSKIDVLDIVLCLVIVGSLVSIVFILIKKYKR